MTNNLSRYPVHALAFAVVLAIASPLGTFALGTSPPEKSLPITLHRQNTLVWCWAASIAMVVEYVTGDAVDDCDILSAYDRKFQGPGMCCQGDGRCQRGGQPGEITFILGELYGVQGQVLARRLTFAEITRSIDAGGPIIAWLQNGPATAHVIVVSGYRHPNHVTVLDPLVGQLEVTYGALATYGGTGAWNLTYLIRGDSAPAPVSPGDLDPDDEGAGPAGECLERDYDQDGVEWHKTVDDPTVDYDYVFTNICDRSISCEFQVFTGHVSRETKDMSSWVRFRASKVERFELKPGQTRRIAGTLEWPVNRPNGTMPRIQLAYRAQ